MDDVDFNKLSDESLRRWAIEQAMHFRWDDDDKKVIAFAEKLLAFVKGEENE